MARIDDPELVKLRRTLADELLLLAGEGMPISKGDACGDSYSNGDSWSADFDQVDLLERAFAKTGTRLGRHQAAHVIESIHGWIKRVEKIRTLATGSRSRRMVVTEINKTEIIKWLDSQCHGR